MSINRIYTLQEGGVKNRDIGKKKKKKKEVQSVGL